MSLASKDFNRKTLSNLKKMGVAVIGSTWVPGADGTFANGERAYQLNDNGCSKLRTYLEVVAMGA